MLDGKDNAKIYLGFPDDLDPRHFRDVLERSMKHEEVLKLILCPGAQCKAARLITHSKWPLGGMYNHGNHQTFMYPGSLIFQVDLLLHKNGCARSAMNFTAPKVYTGTGLNRMKTRDNWNLVCNFQPSFGIGSPLFDKVTIQLSKKYYPGKTFIIETTNNSKTNAYVKSIMLNGKPVREPFILLRLLRMAENGFTNGRQTG